MFNYNVYSQKEIENIDSELEKIFVIFHSILKTKKASEFFKDVKDFETIIGKNKYKISKKVFWDKFTSKYNLPNLEKLCHGYTKYMELVFTHCIVPLDTEFCMLPKPISPKAIGWGLLWHIKRLFEELWLSFLVFLVAFSFTILSAGFIGYHDLAYNEWFSDFFMALASSLYVGLIIAWLNRYFKRKRILIENNFFELQNKNNFLYSRVNQRIKECNNKKNISNKDIVSCSAGITNMLYSYFRNTRLPISVKTCSAYHTLKKYFIEFDNYCGEIIRRDYSNHFESISTNEFTELKKYILSIELELDKYFVALEQIYRFYQIDIRSVDDKQI
ncbi:MAG: hypothetical protein LBM99_05740 [Bacillales bacterium]|nr:hypothetical protein [Bacillales bacterium]